MFVGRKSPTRNIHPCELLEPAPAATRPSLSMPMWKSVPCWYPSIICFNTRQQLVPDTCLYYWYSDILPFTNSSGASAELYISSHRPLETDWRYTQSIFTYLASDRKNALALLSVQSVSSPARQESCYHVPSPPRNGWPAIMLLPSVANPAARHTHLHSAQAAVQVTRTDLPVWAVGFLRALFWPP